MIQSDLEDDLVMIEGANEEIISKTLRKHYASDRIYAWVGASHSVLVSTNPYKKVPIYSKELMVLHHERPPHQKLHPHPFSLASDSYNSMLFTKENQSILISGESGAGKTFTTKQCLAFLAEVAGSETNCEEKILASNPILEAYGNAQTIRNNNSSRFGKWIKIYFDPVKRSIKSGKIVNYLLEKSRICYQQRDSVERNFHIFYQLLADNGIKAKYKLQSPEKYHYLNQSGCYKANDIDDLKEFEALNKSMEQLEFSSEEKEAVFKLTCAILKLGNVQFTAKTEDTVEASYIDNDGKDALLEASSLIGIEEAKLQNILCHRFLTIRGQSTKVHLNPTSAATARDSLAMEIYSRLFDWLVGHINRNLEGDRGRFIGILDIFGFEIFDQNSFEQLCINFANEKLQQHFNRTTFKEEEALYISEGIQFNKIEFNDNQDVLDLIEKKPHGILPLLDDECIVPEGADIKFIKKVEDKHKDSNRFQYDIHRKQENVLSFEIIHYAGTVDYTANDFMSKNMDTMLQAMYDVCTESNNKLLSGLFPKSTGRRQQKSVSFQFRKQLDDLMSCLYSTESRYIRCIKPNDAQQPNQFETERVIEQLNYSGVFEAVQIRKQGYPFRLRKKQFLYRYRCININYQYTAKEIDEEASCKEIIERSALTNHRYDDIQFGRTMVLYRAKEHKTLQRLRDEALEKIIPHCIRTIRGGLARCFARALRGATELLQQTLDNHPSEIKMIDRAISESSMMLEPFQRLFSSNLHNLEKAKSHRGKLQLWVDIEAKLEALVKIEVPSEADLENLRQAVKDGRDNLHIPRTKRQIELFEMAKDHIIHCEIGIQERYLDKEGYRYSSLNTFEGLRSKSEFSKGFYFGRRKIENGMYKWSKSKIPNSLTKLDNMYINIAKKAHSDLRKYMGDKSMKSKSDDDEDRKAAGQRFVQVGIDNPDMRDELFVQIIKQCTENPQGRECPGISRAYKLLAFCLAAFVPSREFENHTMMFIRKLPDEKRRNYMLKLKETKYGKPTLRKGGCTAFTTNPRSVAA